MLSKVRLGQVTFLKFDEKKYVLPLYAILFVNFII
jgi:hypothetical protein